MVKSKNYIDFIFILTIVLLTILPVKIVNIFHYSMHSGYLSIFIFSIILPILITSSKTNIYNKTTLFIWGIRFLSTTIFLIKGFQVGISLSDIISFGGTIALTFYYEFGYFLIATNQYGFFIKAMAWASSILCIYLLIAIAPIVNQMKVFAIYMPVVRDTFHYAYPNGLGIFLVLVVVKIWYLGKTIKNYYLLIIPNFSLLVMTFSRAAMICLGIIMILIFIRNRHKFRYYKFKVVFITVILISLFIFVNVFKGLDSHSIKGTSFTHSFKQRISRWGSIFDDAKKNMIFGLGFRSVSKSITGFRTKDGNIGKFHSVHNDYLDILVRGGIIFSIVFWFFIFSTLRKGFLILNEKSGFLEVAVYSLIVMLIASTNQNVLKIPLTASLFWISIAVIGHKVMMYRDIPK